MTGMNVQVKEILLKQMELLQEESRRVDTGMELSRDLAVMSSAMAELASAYAALSTSSSSEI